MLGLGSSLLQGGALRSIVRSGLQLFYKADRTQAPLGEEKVRNNSFDEISGNLVSNPTFDLGSEAIQNRAFNLGSEEVVDGDFSSSVNWADSGNQWVINNNTATYTGDSNPNELLQEISFIGGRTYEIKIDVASIGGSLKVRFNNEQANKAVFNQTGIQTLYITASGSGNITDDLSISRESQVAFNAVLNSVSVREVPNWSFQNSAWSINNDKALYDGTLTSYISQSGLTISSDKTYQVSFDIEDSSEQSRIQISNQATNETYSPYTDRANGSYVVTFTPSSNQTTLAFKGHISGGSFSLSNVSLKEVPNWSFQNSAWSINNNKALYDDTATSYISQSGLTITAGKTYQVSFDI